jgi:hypothetical protein
MSKFKNLPKPKPNIEAEIEKLASLSSLEYELVREAKAKEFGMRTSALDKEVSKARKIGKKDDLQGFEFAPPEIEPWPVAVVGEEVLDAIAKRFSHYIALPEGAADMMTLWSAHTHIFDMFVHTPRLNITAPSKGCGKSTSRDVVAQFVPRPMPSENMSTAVLFRMVTLHKPTVLADEYDAWLINNNDLRGLLNAGHHFGAHAHRIEGDDHNPRTFEVFAPVVLCGIGALPETLADRSIIVKLVRAKPGELQARFDGRRVDVEKELVRKLARWTKDIRERINDDPALPESAGYRVADNWRPLFAIAEAAGGEWVKRCASAFELLTGKGNDAENIRIELLTDIRRVLQSDSGFYAGKAVMVGDPAKDDPLLYYPKKEGRIFTSDLLDKLRAIEESPWEEVRKGDKPIDGRWLCSMLKEFEIKSKQFRVKEKNAKGYELADFTDTFSRYLPALEPSFDVIDGGMKTG